MNKRIKAARGYANLSQQALADKVGTTRRQIQRWEAGDQEPAASKITLIAAATGVTVNYLLGDFPRLPGTWAPLLVIPTSEDTPQTAEAAAELIGTATDEPRDVDDIGEAIADGWITWEDGALVMWQDGDRDAWADELYRMLVR